MGKPPFQSRDPERLLAKINSGRVKPLVGYSKRLCEIISQMLKYPTQHRPTTEEILCSPRLWLEYNKHEEEKLQSRFDDMQGKVEQWRRTNTRESKLEDSIKAKDDKKERELGRELTRIEGRHACLKTDLDEELLGNVKELRLNFQDFHKFRDILFSVSRNVSFSSVSTSCGSLTDSRGSSSKGSGSRG